MRININSEEYMKSKLNKHMSIVTTTFFIFVIYLTIKLLIQTSHVGFWLLGLTVYIISSIIYIYLMMQHVAQKEPYVVIYDDMMLCNFKQVPTKTGSLKRKFLGTYESIEDECKLNVVTHYELTKKHIIAYGYSNEDIRELTGFVIERFFDEDDELMISNWLQAHISNIHDSKTQYMIR